MKQKLIAVAVAGIFAAPAVALAQASTVQIYGTLNAEYGFAGGNQKTPTTTSNSWDGLNSAASNLGFKGEEKLGGGMSAWFQCETDLGFLKGDSNANDQGTAGAWCGRNSALGVKSGFGSFYVGNWDSPTKRVVAQHRILGETGWHGVQGMLISNGGGFTGTYSARNANSLNYDSPNFSGFTVNAQTTSTKAAATVVTAGLAGRSSSFSLNYSAGPLAASLGYTAQDDNRAGGTTAGVNGRKDSAVVLGGSYTIGAAKIGLLYIDATSQPSATTELTRKSWNIAGTYQLSGPHSLIGGYTLAGDTKTNEAGVVAERGADTGANQYTIGYRNALSKRTFAGVTYMRAKNDDRAIGYSVGNNHMAAMNPGASSDVIAMQLNHKF
jgi:predicted porin